MIPAVIVAIDVWNYAIFIDRNRVMTAEALGGSGAQWWSTLCTFSHKSTV